MGAHFLYEATPVVFRYPDSIRLVLLITRSLGFRWATYYTSVHINGIRLGHPLYQKWYVFSVTKHVKAKKGSLRENIYCCVFSPTPGLKWDGIIYAPTSNQFEPNKILRPRKSKLCVGIGTKIHIVRVCSLQKRSTYLWTDCDTH